jgi:hypothetical protein
MVPRANVYPGSATRLGMFLMRGFERPFQSLGNDREFPYVSKYPDTLLIINKIAVRPIRYADHWRSTCLTPSPIYDNLIDPFCQRMAKMFVPGGLFGGSRSRVRATWLVKKHQKFV